MPGKVLATHVEVGATVEKGELLVILEAMKMEHRITAPVAGTVTAVHGGLTECPDCYAAAGRAIV